MLHIQHFILFNFEFIFIVVPTTSCLLYQKPVDKLMLNYFKLLFQHFFNQFIIIFFYYFIHLHKKLLNLMLYDTTMIN